MSTLEQRVAAALDAHRPQLAELVRQAVDAELERLVDQELAQRSNGAALRRCSGACGRNLEPSKFAPGRGVCRECRQQQARDREQRRAGGDPEPPRPGPTAHG